MTRRAIEIIVFGLVGATATAIYFGVAIVLYAIPPFDTHPASAAFIASVASVLWSYAGHHHFTFRKTGSHHFYLPRFLAISIVLSTMAVCGVYFAIHSFGVDYQAAIFGVTVSYPLASFVLNREWVFRVPAAGVQATGCRVRWTKASRCLAPFFAGLPQPVRPATSSRPRRKPRSP
jgi:putative flippase GtrA